MALPRRISLFLLAAGTALAVTCCGRSMVPREHVTSTAAPLAARSRAPFAVVIVVDQLSAWVAASRLPELPENGGFARLRREGTWVKNMRYPYAVTDTGPGHAALHTGKVPASISLKDRGAILPGGKHPSHALWFDASLDSFVTSTAFEARFPEWAAPLGDRSAVTAARRAPWELGDRAWVEAHAAAPDDQRGEGNLDGLGVVFPHVARTAAAFRALPASDGMIVELALAAMDAEYDPSRPTLLLLSMSASDIVGHVFGPDSWEAWDQLRKLDARLAQLIDALDRRVGAPVPVLVAGDHGNRSIPELAPGRAGARIDPRALERALVSSTRAALGGGDWIGGIVDPYLFLTPPARALDEERRAALDRAIRSTLSSASDDAIEEVLDVRALAQRCPAVLLDARGIPARALAGEDILTLVCRAWAPLPGAGDYYLVARAGAAFDGDIVPGKGASHGSPRIHDRTVPMLVRGPGIAPGAVIDAPVDFSAFAALEASFVGLDAGGAAPRSILARSTAN